ncbi:MAG: hypothetical protein K2O48_04995, partial [Prevotella sp.]|nr:hypothetical protein [Prevotella sp.]
MIAVDCLCKLSIGFANLSVVVYQFVNALVSGIQIVEISIFAFLWQLVNQLSHVTHTFYIAID